MCSNSEEEPRVQKSAIWSNTFHHFQTLIDWWHRGGRSKQRIRLVEKRLRFRRYPVHCKQPWASYVYSGISTSYHSQSKNRSTGPCSLKVLKPLPVPKGRQVKLWFRVLPFHDVRFYSCMRQKAPMGVSFSKTCPALTWHRWSNLCMGGGAPPEPTQYGLVP